MPADDDLVRLIHGALPSIMAISSPRIKETVVRGHRGMMVTDAVHRVSGLIH